MQEKRAEKTVRMVHARRVCVRGASGRGAVRCVYPSARYQGRLAGAGNQRARRPVAQRRAELPLPDALADRIVHQTPQEPAEF